MKSTVAITVLSCSLALGASTFTLPGVAQAQAQAQARALTIHDAWVRLPLGGRTETAAFAVIENAGAQLRAVTGVSTPSAQKGELHEMKRVGEMMQMSPVARIEVAARGKVELKPGGLHVMLFGLKGLKAGDSVELTFTFDDGTSTKVTAPVRAADGAAPAMKME